MSTKFWIILGVILLVFIVAHYYLTWLGKRGKLNPKISVVINPEIKPSNESMKDVNGLKRMMNMVKSLKHIGSSEFWLTDAEKYNNLSDTLDRLSVKGTNEENK